MGAGVSEMVKNNPGFVDSRNVRPPPPPRDAAANRRLLIVFDLNGIFLNRGAVAWTPDVNPFAELFLRHAARIPGLSYAFWTAAVDSQAEVECATLARLLVSTFAAATESSPHETNEVPFNPLFVWGQSKCLVPVDRTSKDRSTPGKPLFLKPVRAVWEAFPEFNRNVLIVDHSKEKLLLNPSWSQIVPLPFNYWDHPAQNPLAVITKSIKDWRSLEAQDLKQSFHRTTDTFSIFTWDSTVLTAENGWMPISKVHEGSLIWTGICCGNDEHSQQQKVFRRLLRKWEFALPPERGRVSLVHLAPGCIATPLHIVFWHGKWQEACRTTLDDAAPSAWIEAPCTCVFNLELDGHEDVVCVGGVVAAAVGFFHRGSQSRMWECSVWSRRSRHCSDPTCPICDTVLVPDLASNRRQRSAASDSLLRTKGFSASAMKSRLFSTLPLPPPLLHQQQSASTTWPLAVQRRWHAERERG